MVMAIYGTALLTFCIGVINGNERVMNAGLAVATVLTGTGLLHLIVTLSDWLWSAPFAWGW